MIGEIADRPPVDAQFGRAQEDALRIGQREIANDHLAIKRAVEPADADLHPVLELIFFDLGDDEAPSGVAVQADKKQREEQEEPEKPERSEEHTSELQ